MRRRRRQQPDGTYLCKRCGEYKLPEHMWAGGLYCKLCSAQKRGVLGKQAEELWESVHGPIPDWGVLAFRPGVEPRDWTIDDLEVVQRSSYYLVGNEGAIHRKVWEAANGPIPDGWIVHHKDGNVYNNSLDNLEAMPRAEHTRHHNEERQDVNRELGQKVGLKNRKVGPPGTSWCFGCQEFLPEDSFTKSKRSWNGLDPLCRKCKKERRMRSSK